MSFRLSTLAAPVFLLTLWECAFLFDFFPYSIIPAPSVAVRALVNLFYSGVLIPAVFSTLLHICCGYVPAVSAGIILAILAESFPLLRNLYAPVLEVIRPITPIAWVPLVLIAVGPGSRSAASIVFIAAIFPVFVSTLSAFNEIAPDWRELGKLSRLSSVDTIRVIILPALLPGIATGLRLSAASAWMSVVAAEMSGVQSGLGNLLMLGRMSLAVDEVVGIMIVLGLLGAATNYLIEAWAAPRTRWKVLRAGAC